MARKYLSKCLPVAKCDNSARFRKFWQSRIALCLFALPWLALFIACGGGGSSYVADSPATTNTTSTPVAVAPTSSPSGKSDATLEVEARALAWGVVEKHLKYPHDAKFSWGTECKRLNDESFAAWGTVKAANALGAKLTHEWRVVLAVNEEDRFLPIYIQIGEEESALASDDAIARFLGKPTSAEVDELVRQKEAEQQLLDAEAARQAEFREWSDTSGEFSVRARYVSFRNHEKYGGMVTLEKEDGSTKELPIDKLSKDDAEWVRSEMKRQAGRD